MKGFLAGIFKFHFIPFLIATVISVGCIALFIQYKPVDGNPPQRIISGKQTMLRGLLSNCVGSEQSEIELAGALKNKSVLTIFGSSELSDLKYSSYFFLPDSLHMPTVAFGHAFHQNLSISCELLAMSTFAKRSKICIILSPGWFETEGTNIEAFLEFVRPNFLRSIIHNDSIPIKFKLEIGRFLSENYRDIATPSESINYLRDLYLCQNIPFFSEALKPSKRGIEAIRYEVQTVSVPEHTISEIDWDLKGKQLQEAFIESIKTNTCYVNDDYFKTYLLKNGVFKKSKISALKEEDNPEFKNFRMLVEILKMYDCDASFIIQPLNPYVYDDLNKFDKTISKIERVLKENNFSYLNLFVDNVSKYEPGILNDIMHPGDYGWMKINQFLYQKYK